MEINGELNNNTNITKRLWNKRQNFYQIYLLNFGILLQFGREYFSMLFFLNMKLKK